MSSIIGSSSPNRLDRQSLGHTPTVIHWAKTIPTVHFYLHKFSIIVTEQTDIIVDRSPLFPISSWPPWLRPLLPTPRDIAYSTEKSISNSPSVINTHPKKVSSAQPMMICKKNQIRAKGVWGVWGGMPLQVQSQSKPSGNLFSSKTGRKAIKENPTKRDAKFWRFSTIVNADRGDGYRGSLEEGNGCANRPGKRKHMRYSKKTQQCFFVSAM